MKRRRFFSLAVAFFLLTALGLVLMKDQSFEQELSGNGLFSWEAESLLEENSRDLFAVMKKYGLRELYQNIPEDIEIEVLREFLEEAAGREISVYLLTGDPMWGLDQNGERVTGEVRRAADLNQRLHQDARLSGVMFDVEPYLTREWKEAPDWVMRRYLSGMRAAYREAEEQKLQSVVCIPYYYDTMGYTRELEELIRDGCHKIAVMNYYKGREADHIRTELAAARTYDREIMTIYELQPPGSSGVKRENTYFGEGVEAVLKNFRELSGKSGAKKLSFGLHDYRALAEVERDE